MEFLLQIVGGLCALASIGCFIYVLIMLFQDGQTGLGVLCLVTLCLGIGGIIAFVLGWMNAAKWDIKGVMLVWTVAIVIAVAINAYIRFGMGGVVI